MVICLERDAYLHMAQLIPLPLTVSCFSKIQIGFTFLVPAHLGSPGKRAIKRVFVVRYCYYYLYLPSVLWRCWLGGRKGIRRVKNWAVGCWHGYLFGARCRLAYGPADATATYLSLASLKSCLVLLFWYRLTSVVLDKGPLNGCCFCVVSLLLLLEV